MDPGVTIVLPVWRRPWRIEPVYRSARAATPDAVILFVVSADDQPTRDTVGDLLAGTRDPRVEPVICSWPGGSPGDYCRKINAGAAEATTPYIFQGADDLAFSDGWYDEALIAFAPGIGVVGTNDLGNPRVTSGRHATHSLLSAAYVAEHGTIDEPGKVLHEGYPHEFCDDELVHTAKFRNAFAFAPRSVVEHLHPNWGKAADDDVYVHGHSGWAVGQALYRQREPLWRGRSSVPATHPGLRPPTVVARRRG